MKVFNRSLKNVIDCVLQDFDKCIYITNFQGLFVNALFGFLV